MWTLLTEEITSTDKFQNYKKSLFSQNIKPKPKNFTLLHNKKILNNSHFPGALISICCLKPADIRLSCDKLKEENFSICCNKSGCVWCFVPTLASSMQHSPRQRELQALDLRTYDIEAAPQRPYEQYSNKDARIPKTSHSTAPKQMQQPRGEAATLRKGNSSSEQSINQRLSRSCSMIDLPLPRANPLRLRAGYDHFSTEEEEVKKFYQSIDPSIAFDDFEQEPRRPTRQQTARLRAGAPNNCSCPPPQSSNACPDSFSIRPQAQNSRLQNFSSFCPPGAMSGPSSVPASPPYPPSSPRRTSMDHYSSIAPRPPSTICPPISPWLMPMAQSSPMRQSTRPPPSTRGNSGSVYEPSRRNQYSPPSPMNSTRYKGLSGKPFKMPGLSPQTKATQWIQPPGSMPSAFLQQSSIAQPRQQSHWDPSSCPPNFERPLTCPKTEEDACPKDNPNFPCEGCETDEQEFTAPPRCRELDPDIKKKLSCDLPLFKIPRDLEMDFVCIKRREQWEALVKDQNCPGAIQSTVDGKVNFNALAYDIVFGDFRLPECLPLLDPISLLEAFSMRVKYERCQVKKLEKLTYAKDNPDADEETTTPPPNEDCSIITKYFKRKHPTELNAAIEKLLIAEKVFNSNNPIPEMPLMTLSLDRTSTDLPGIPISIKAYTGTTKPRN